MNKICSFDVSRNEDFYEIDKPKDCEKIYVSIRGYYIYKTRAGSYLLEANDKFFEILKDDTHFAEDVDK